MIDLCPGIVAYIDEVLTLEAEGPPATTIADRRRGYVERCRHFDPPRPRGLRIDDVGAAGPHGPVPLRVFRPASAGRLPVVLYLHGGGWVLGDLDSHEGLTAELAGETGLCLVAVDYRLAPEHPFPAAFDDAWAALRFVVAQAATLGVDATRVIVAGDSAGGNLAAALALAARDRGGPALRGQALIYPALDARMSLPGHRAHTHAPLLSAADMKGYWDAYLGAAGGGRDDPYASPLAAPSLAGVAPAFVATAGYDPLVDDGRRYAERLAEAGVPVAFRNAPRLVHGYLRARHLSPDAREETAALRAWLVERA